MSVGYILKFEFWANLLDFGQLGVNAQGVGERLSTFGAQLVVADVQLRAREADRVGSQSVEAHMPW